MTRTMWRRLLPLAVLLLGLALFLLLGLERYLSFEMLGKHQAALADWVAGHQVLAALAYLVGYGLVVAFSLPVAVVVTPLGGFLFGIWLGTALSVLGAMAGAVAVFLAARSALHDLFRARAGGKLGRLEEGFRRDGFSYLLFLRLVPIFPFWLINIVPALLGMPLAPYALATLLGIIPGALVYSSVGSGLGDLLAQGKAPDPGIIFQWRFLLPLLGLAALSLAPVAYRHLRHGRTSW